MKILGLGEALVDVVHAGDTTVEHVGGSMLNVACGLGRLGHDSTLACWIGPDDRGRRIADYAAASDVVLAAGSDGADRTPTAFAEVDAAGKATYTFDFASDLPVIADLDAYGHLHAGSISAAFEPGGTKIVEALGAASGTRSYDPNVRPALLGTPAEALPRVHELVALADVVKASDEDLAWLYPELSDADAARGWAAMGPALVVVTRGGDGALALLASEGVVHEVAPGAASVVDTVGAGDSFMAGLISGLADLGLLGSAEARARLREASWTDVEPALKRAIATSAITVGHAGAYGPTRDEIGAD